MKNKGFSLVELTVTLAITAVVALMAIPSATQSMLRASVDGAAGQIIALSGFARTEALRRSSNIMVCGAVLDSSKKPTACSGATDWSSGILIYQDLNLNNGYSDEERIKFIRFDNGITVTANQQNMTIGSTDVDRVNNLTICVGKSYAGLNRFLSQQIRLSSYTASVICSRTDNATCAGC